MMKQLLLTCTFALPFFFFGQKKQAFQGKLIYQIEIQDTNLRSQFPTSIMTVYTNDTIVRIDNTTSQLGAQSLILHTLLNKSYLLLQTPKGNFAIQTNHNAPKNQDSVAYTPKYTYKKLKKRQRYLSYKLKRLAVENANFKTPLTFLYDPTLSPKYINAFLDFPGLPYVYYLATPDGIFKYSLIKREDFIPKKETFGLPEDYKKVSFEDFLKEMVPENQVVPKD